MERLNDEGQWIIMIGFVTCIIMLFLALILAESTLVGQTTAEGVLEFPKSDIQDLKNEISRIEGLKYSQEDLLLITNDIQKLSLERNNAVIALEIQAPYITNIHYDNGVTIYDETV